MKENTCMNCKYWNRVSKVEGYCEGMDFYCTESDTCSYFKFNKGADSFVELVSADRIIDPVKDVMVNVIRFDKLDMVHEGVISCINTRVYGLEESIIASGYPMQSTPVGNMLEQQLGEKDYKRGIHLGKAIPGSGHDCYLKGVIVQFDVKAGEYWYRQFDRYHFRDYVSSQSKMHRLLKFDVNEICNAFVSKELIERLNATIDLYNNFNEEEAEGMFIRLRNGKMMPYNRENLWKVIIANVPAGLSLTARITTNYLQLKSIYNQRHNHKLQEWHSFCAWIENLPAFVELTRGEIKKEEK